MLHIITESTIVTVVPWRVQQWLWIVGSGQQLVDQSYGFVPLPQHSKALPSFIFMPQFSDHGTCAIIHLPLHGLQREEEFKNAAAGQSKED